MQGLSEIRGLNIFSVYALTTLASKPEGNILVAPILTVIKNKSKSLTWIYVPSCWGIPRKGEDVIRLSHWNFGNQLEAGDQVSVSVIPCQAAGIQVREWGFQVVHEPVEKMFNQHNTDLNVIGGDLSELYLLIPRMYLLCGGPIESCKMWQRLFGQALFNFSGLIADSNVDAEADWQRLLFGEKLDTEAFWQAMCGEPDWQRLYKEVWEEFGPVWRRLFKVEADWQRVFSEAFVKNFSSLIANSDVDAEVGELLIYI
ncbi:hypothetical protein M0R45_034846 [Rubus argutus]|uniref:Uncharacterized protein n=1 Tax=Rubus argutus TaxID=59490 RepID=A0AAW1VVQ6_RUBAR